MEWFSQDRFDVRLEWGLSAIDYLAKDADCAVIVDVMSFSTCVSLAIDNGARIYPWPWKDGSAIEYAIKIGAKTASPDRKFHSKGYSLSPVSIRSISDGESLVLPSPNGSAISFISGGPRLQPKRLLYRACQQFNGLFPARCSVAHKHDVMVWNNWHIFEDIHAPGNLATVNKADG